MPPQHYPLSALNFDGGDSAALASQVPACLHLHTINSRPLSLQDNICERGRETNKQISGTSPPSTTTIWACGQTASRSR